MVEQDDNLVNIQNIARQKFSNADGEILLGWILSECYFLSDCSVENLPLNNFAKKIIIMMYGKDDGTLDPSWFETLKRIIRRKK